MSGILKQVRRDYSQCGSALLGWDGAGLRLNDLRTQLSSSLAAINQQYFCLEFFFNGADFPKPIFWWHEHHCLAGFMTLFIGLIKFGLFHFSNPLTCMQICKHATFAPKNDRNKQPGPFIKPTEAWECVLAQTSRIFLGFVWSFKCIWNEETCTLDFICQNTCAGKRARFCTQDTEMQFKAF